MKWLKILRRQRYPIRFSISRLLRATGLWRFFFIKKKGYRLRLHPASLALALWVDSEDRSSDCELVRRILNPGDTYIDVGANIGQLVVEAALKVGQMGQVVAFEPHPRMAAYLRENVTLNNLKNVKIAQAALANHTGWVALTDSRSDDQNRVSETGIDVPALQLSPFLEYAGQVELLKIDVEGYELFVLQGAAEELRRIKHIYFEAMDEHYTACGYTFSEVHDFLEGNGFSVGTVESGKFISVFRDSRFDECCNLFATRTPDGLVERLS